MEPRLAAEAGPSKMGGVRARYRVIAPIGTGPEGARYRGVDAEGRPVVLHVLHPRRFGPPRLSELEARLQILSAISGPEIAAVIEVEREPSRWTVVVQDDSARSLAEALAGGLSKADGASKALDLLRAIRKAHRLGLVHGTLALAEVGVRADGSLCLDLTGLRTVDLPRRSLEPLPPAEVHRPTPETDAYVMARLVLYLLGVPRGPELDLGPLALPEPVYRCFRGLLDPDPAQRPTVDEAVRALAPWLSERAGLSAPPVTPPPPPPQRDEVLGRYRLLAELGRGGIGEVYRAEEIGTKRQVALKVLRGEFQDQEGVIQRFRREARLLEQLRHPNIVELFEVNEVDGIHFMVMELIEGPNLNELLKRRGRIPEREALLLMADVARGLSAAHAQGVIHRDVKPHNVLLAERLAPVEGELPYEARVCDFGIARALYSDDTGLTQNEALGTPRYMAPEQCVPGGTVGTAADVYAMGMTLFQLLTSRIAYDAQSALELIYAHLNLEPLDIRTLLPEVSAGTAALIDRALAKSPAERPQDAQAFLDALLELLGKKPPAFDHPAFPRGAKPSEVLAVAHRFDLKASPAAIWANVSNTERLNKAIGLPAVEWSFMPSGDGSVQLFGSSTQVGMKTSWREHPYEWIEGQKLGVLREYSEGPLEWYVSAVSLTPLPGGGTTLTHRLWLKPRNILAHAAAWAEAKHRLRGKLERVYRRIADHAFFTDDTARPDPFEAEREASSDERRRTRERLDGLKEQGVGEAARTALERLLLRGPDQEVARIRPIPLARLAKVPEREMIDACLIGAKLGLLVPLWDVICPTCKIPSAIEKSLEAIETHAFCPACSASFGVDLSRSVELIFKADPSLRSADLRTYCIGGPAHSPHAAVQLVLQEGEAISFELALEEGRYLLRTTREDWALELSIAPGAALSALSLHLEPGGPSRTPAALRAGAQKISLENHCGGERVFRLERLVSREDAFSAADASAHPLFRQLFPEQRLKSGVAISMESITLLLTDVHRPELLYDSLGEVEMLGLLHQHLRRVAALVEAGGGSVLKAQSHGLVAAFAKVDDAVAVGMKLVAPGKGAAVPVIAAVHRGPAMAATVGERLDYFGRIVTHLPALLEVATPERLIVSEEVAEVSGIEARWEQAGWSRTVVMLKGEELEFAMGLEVKRAGGDARAVA
ncbi:MAG: protein kinase [Myxococcota bacterium]